MSWFRKKGKYWYFVERINGKEQQHYIGDDAAVKTKLFLSEGLLPCKNLKSCQVDPLYCPFRNPAGYKDFKMCEYYELDTKLLPKKNE